MIIINGVEFKKTSSIRKALFYKYILKKETIAINNTIYIAV